MNVSLKDGELRLDELVNLAEHGEDVVLTIDGRPSVRLTPVTTIPTPAEKRAIIRQIQATTAHDSSASVSAARSQDFLYDEFGLPA